MRQAVIVASSVVVLSVLAGSIPAYAAESMNTGSAATKGLRGLVNVVTGWVEIPKRIHETALESGTAAGVTWGLLRGLGYGFIRTVAGCYEVLTFPFPAPPDYQPVMEPEFVFS